MNSIGRLDACVLKIVLASALGKFPTQWMEVILSLKDGLELCVNGYHNSEMIVPSETL